MERIKSKEEKRRERLPMLINFYIKNMCLNLLKTKETTIRMDIGFSSKSK